MMRIFIKDLDAGMRSNPVDIDWLLFGDEDLEFENGETLTLNDFKFYRREYEICPIELQSAPVSDTTEADSSNADGSKNNSVEVDESISDEEIKKHFTYGYGGDAGSAIYGAKWMRAKILNK